MDERRILITGANGFVGRHLIAHLLDSYGMGVSLIAAVHPRDVEHLGIVPASGGWTGASHPQIMVVGLDVEDAPQVHDTITRLRPDQVVHLAARSSGADADRSAVMAVNVEGTRRLLEAASNVTPFPRFLAVSTGYVYGDTDPARPAKEDDPVGPMWRFGPYTDSKIEMESVVRGYRSFALLARPFSHTGPGQAPMFAIPGFARQLARIERGLDPPVIRVGNLAAKRDILDVRDVVRAYSMLLTSGQPGEVYNIATGNPAVIGDLLDQLRSSCRVPTRVEIDPDRLRPLDIACSSGDPLKLWMSTNWNARVPLETTLRDTLDYWRSACETEPSTGNARRV